MLLIPEFKVKMELKDRDINILAYVDNFKIRKHIDSIEIKKREKENYFISISQHTNDPSS